MKNKATAILMAALMVCLALPAFALEPYVQDFEGLNAADTGALAADGWLVFGNVFGPDWAYWYGYGTFPAPNDGAAFCNIGVDGTQFLNVFSDYNNTDHGVGAHIEANVFQEQNVGPGDVGETWVFSFDAMKGNIADPTTALAFIKTLDPNAGWATTNFITIDMTSAPATWSGFSIAINIDSSLNGQILQFGFANTATNYDPSGVYYDNISFHIDGPVPVEEQTWGSVKSLFR